ncbi:phage tail-collar fiber domain-containing protein [Spartinivicinus ruber]|uniref:phage tail-collar fiber domain-containing protein n=1 Tax=Spartinivicinus ruber TaxID=2683272 RepID=UPI0013D1E1FD|nr:phage tail protein [Spartinivicinus ruber]
MNDNYCLITNKGLEKEARARVDNTKIKLVEFAVGDGELPDDQKAVAARTALINQQFRAAVNGVFVDSKHPTQIKVNAVVPHDIGGWFIREVGIYDADGDLYAIGRVDPTFKNEPDSGAKKQVGFNFYIASANAAQITLTIDPDTVYATRDMLTAMIEMHVSQVDPHPQYIPKSQLGKNKGQIPVVGDFGLGELIQENKADIDAIKNFGFYHVTEAAGTLPLGYGVNDSESAFYLEVLAGGDNLIYQRLQPVQENRKFERRFIENNWQPWREVAFVDALKHELSSHEAAPNPHPQYALQAGHLSLLPIMPELVTPDNRLAVELRGSVITVKPGQIIRWRGWKNFNTADYPESQRAFDYISVNKTYHLRWSPVNGFQLRDLQDSVYNPQGLTERDLSFDSTYDDVLMGGVGNGVFYTAIIKPKRVYRYHTKGNGLLRLPLGYRDRSFRLLVTIRNQLQQGNVLFKSVDKAHTALFTMRGNNHGDNMNVELDSDDKFLFTSNNSNGEVSISTLTGDIIDDLLYMQNHQSEYVKKVSPDDTIDGDEELFSMGIKRLTIEDVQKGLPLEYEDIESASIVFEVF